MTLHNRTAQFFRTLQNQPYFSQVPRSLQLYAGFDGPGVLEGDPDFEYRDEAIQFFLKKMPKVNSLRLNETMWDYEYVRNQSSAIVNDCGNGPRRADSQKGKCRRKLNKLDPPQNTTNVSASPSIAPYNAHCRMD